MPWQWLSVCDVVRHEDDGSLAVFWPWKQPKSRLHVDTLHRGQITTSSTEAQTPCSRHRMRFRAAKSQRCVAHLCVLRVHELCSMTVAPDCVGCIPLYIVEAAVVDVHNQGEKLAQVMYNNARCISDVEGHAAHCHAAPIAMRLWSCTPMHTASATSRAMRLIAMRGPLPSPSRTCMVPFTESDCGAGSCLQLPVWQGETAGCTPSQPQRMSVHDAATQQGHSFLADRCMHLCPIVGVGS